MVNGFASIEQVTDRYLNGKQIAKATAPTMGLTFTDVLQSSLESAAESNGVKFSKHASMRLNDRNISLSEEQNDRLFEGVEKAKQKGIQDSLVLLDSFAFIVNVPSQTVVTAMDKEESLEKVFTNIDGAVIA